jgi:hypothetical protein
MFSISKLSLHKSDQLKRCQDFCCGGSKTTQHKQSRETKAQEPKPKPESKLKQRKPEALSQQ